MVRGYSLTISNIQEVNKMAITAQMVKELREKTGAGMMDCKKLSMKLMVIQKQPLIGFVKKDQLLLLKKLAVLLLKVQSALLVQENQLLLLKLTRKLISSPVTLIFKVLLTKLLILLAIHSKQLKVQEMPSLRVKLQLLTKKLRV